MANVIVFLNRTTKDETVVVIVIGYGTGSIDCEDDYDSRAKGETVLQSRK